MKNSENVSIFNNHIPEPNTPPATDSPDLAMPPMVSSPDPGPDDDLLETEERAACHVRALEVVCMGLNDCWNVMARVYDRGVTSLGFTVEHRLGHTISYEDVASVMLLFMNIVEAMTSSRIWISERVEISVSALVNVITLMNDRANQNNKFAKLSRLQLDFIRILQQAPHLVERLDFNTRHGGKYMELSALARSRHLEKCWEKSNAMRIKLHGGTEVTLYNFTNIKNRYVQFINMAIIMSWSMAFLNIAFDIAKMFQAPEGLVNLSLEDDKGKVAFDMQVDFSNVLNSIPVVGNYSISGNCRNNCKFTGKMFFHLGRTTAAYRAADRIITGLGGIPYRGIASWFTGYRLPQQPLIRKSVHQFFSAFKSDFDAAIHERREANKIPREAVQVLRGTGQSDLATRAAELRAFIEVHNKRVLHEKGRKTGRKEATEGTKELILGFKREESRRALDLQNVRKKLMEASAILEKTENEIAHTSPRTAEKLRAQHNDIINAAHEVKRSEERGSALSQDADKILNYVAGISSSEQSSAAGGLTTAFATNSPIAPAHVITINKRESSEKGTADKGTADDSLRSGTNSARQSSSPKQPQPGV